MESGTLVAGRYEILSQLGGGGGGLVYKALDRTTDNLVAVKVLRPHLLQDRSAREKFELEVRIAGRVRSEHLVRVLDAGLDSSTQLSFLVMELLDGQTLEELVAYEGPLDRYRAVEYVRQVAFGLDKVHARKDMDGRPTPTLHRDLKPSNLMLTHREDDTPLVKILDWGIAKVLSDPGTVTFDIKGTPLYMAPEQLSPPAPLTPATDVCAMGLVAFFLLTGHSYWRTGQSANAVLAAIVKEVCEGPMTPPRARLRELGLRVDLPPAFDVWFAKCLNLDQAKRYQSAGEAARELAAALEVSLRESHPPSESRHSHDRPTLDGGSTALSTTLASMPSPPMPGSKVAKHQPTAPKHRTRIYVYASGMLIGGALVLTVAFQSRGSATPAMPSLIETKTMPALPAPTVAPPPAPHHSSDVVSPPPPSEAPSGAHVNRPRLGTATAKVLASASVRASANADDIPTNDELRTAAKEQVRRNAASAPPPSK